MELGDPEIFMVDSKMMRLYHLLYSTFRVVHLEEICIHISRFPRGNERVIINISCFTVLKIFKGNHVLIRLKKLVNKSKNS